MINFSDVGRIGKDAVVRSTQGGDSVTGFSLAVDSGYGDKKVTLWFDCSHWGKRGESVAPYLLKGTQVFVQGEFGQREHDGKTYNTLRVAELKLIGSKPDGERQERAPRSNAPTPSRSNDEMPDDDIPF